MKSRVLGMLGAGCALIALNGNAEAGCFQRDFDSIFKHMSTSSTSASGTICGQNFSITSPVSRDTRDSVANDKTITGTFNGASLTLTAPTTLGALWADVFDKEGSVPITGTMNGRAVTLTPNRVAHGDDTLKIEIAGSTLFDGTAAQFNSSAYLNILTALGLVDSGTVTRAEVTRSQTQAASEAVSSRVSSVLTSVIASSFSSGGMSGAFGGGAGGFGGGSSGSSGGQGGSGGQGDSDGQGGSGDQNKKDKEKTSSLRGLAAGDADMRFGTWITPSNTWLRNTNSLSRYSGTLQNVMMGADYKALPNFVTGLALGYEGASISTSFNSGNLSNAGFSITPYLGVGLLDGRVAASLLGGYAHTYTDQKSTLDTGVKSTGHYTSDRWMVGANVSGFLPVMENLAFLPGAGITAAWEHRGAYTESDGNRPAANDTVLLEGKLTAKMLYRVDKFDLTGGVSFIHDFVNDKTIGTAVGDPGRDEVSPELGVTYNISDNQYVSVEGNLGLARKNMERGTLQATYRLSF